MKSSEKVSVKIVSRYSNRKCFSISATVKVPVSSKVLWELLTAAGQLELYSPFIAKHRSEKIQGMPYNDKAIFYSGLIIYRQLVLFDEEQKMQFEIKEGNEGNPMFSLLEMKRMNINNTELTITLSSDAYKDVPRPIWYFIAPFFLIPRYRAYLRAICNGIFHFCITGKSVERDQFGKVRGFSGGQNS